MASRVRESRKAADGFLVLTENLYLAFSPRVESRGIRGSSWSQSVVGNKGGDTGEDFGRRYLQGRDRRKW